MRWFLIVSMLLLLSPVVFAAEECISEEDLLKEQIKAEYRFLNYRAEIRKISMEAILQVMEGKQDTTQVQAIKNALEFVMKNNEKASTYQDLDLFDEYQVEMDDLILRFKTAASIKDPLKNFREVVKTALETEDDYLTALRNQAFSARKRLFLMEFDRAECVHHAVILSLNKEEYNIARLEDRLRRVLRYRLNLEAAIDDAHRACLSTPLFACSRDNAEDLVSIQRIVQKGFREISDEIISQGIAERQRLDLDLFSEDLKLMKEKYNHTNWTVSTEEFSRRLEIAIETLKNAEGEFKEGDYGIVDDILIDLNTDWRIVEEEFTDLKNRQAEADNQPEE